MTVCNDKAGCDESVEKARDWIAKNAAGTGVAPPRYRKDQTSSIRKTGRECDACVSHTLGLGLPNVDPCHSIGRDQRPLRVGPTSARSRSAVKAHSGAYSCLTCAPALIAANLRLSDLACGA